MLGPYLEMLGMRRLRGQLAEWMVGRLSDQSETEREIQKLLGAVVEHLAILLPQAEFNTQNTQTHNFDASNTAYVTQRNAKVPTIGILVGDEAACYHALYLVHRLFMPVENGLADNIGAGRLNGYRGISTGVMVPAALTFTPADMAIDEIKEASKLDARRVRINLRIATYAMNEVNHWGLAAFTIRGRTAGPLPAGWWQNAEEGYAGIISAALGSLPDTLYVFSPHGQLFKFQRGSTVIDYAYNVHSELADRCSRFYVNGQPAQPGTLLHHLDLIELEHDPLSPGPTQAWLDAAQTNRARSNIEKHLKRMGQGAYQGQRVVDQRRKALEDHFGFNMPDHQVNRAIEQSMHRLQLTRVEELFAEIAAVIGRPTGCCMPTSPTRSGAKFVYLASSGCVLINCNWPNAVCRDRVRTLWDARCAVAVCSPGSRSIAATVSKWSARETIRSNGFP